MTGRDIALVAYRLLALWIALSAVMALLETLVSWESIVAQTQGALANVSNPPTARALFWMTTSATVARGMVGVLLWWGAPALARRTPVSDSPRSDPSRYNLYSAAAFLVGVWLLSECLPGLAFAFQMAIRPGVLAHDDGLGRARLAQMLAQLLLGIAFIRGGWLVDLAIWRRGDGSAGAEESKPGV
jgi:hypothetical protein